MLQLMQWETYAHPLNNYVEAYLQDPEIILRQGTDLAKHGTDSNKHLVALIPAQQL